MTEVNNKWAEQCYLNFQESIELPGNYQQALACISDMRSIFPDKAKEMQEELRNTPLENFAVRTPLDI